MNIKIARINAVNGLELSRSFIELSPADSESKDAFDWSGKFFLKWLKRVVKWVLIWRLEKLILVPDHIVKSMVLDAMRNLQYVSKNIDTARMISINCLELSKSFIELSPAIRGAIGLSGCNEARSSLKYSLILQLEELVLISDFSVRSVTLRAMKNLRYVSKNIGFIASFYGLEETSKTEETNEQEAFSELIRSYLYEVLNLKELNFFEILTAKIRHWESCLSIDYHKEFRIIRERVEVDGEFIMRERQLSDEELVVELAASKSRTLNLAQQDLREYWEKYFGTDFVERRKEEVYRGLDNIFWYLFTQEKNKKNVGEVLQLLSQFATWKHFPQSWLIGLANKNLNQ